jgi:protein gp37
MVFVNSMSDLFHELVPDEFIAAVFEVMARAERHVFQVLTKRPERMRDFVRNWCAHSFALSPDVGPPPHPLPNVWCGVSIENRRYVDRADALRDTPAAVRFISAEPLLGPLSWDAARPVGKDGIELGWSDGYSGPPLSLREIDWLIVGGESGPDHRPMNIDWVRDLRDECIETQCGGCCSAGGACGKPDCERTTAFFFKQWGGRTPKAGGRKLDGRTWDEMPTRKTASQSGPVTGPMAVVGEVLDALSSAHFRFASEDELQLALATALGQAGLDVEREVRLDAQSRIDLQIGRVGIEVKVAGKPDSVLRQLKRYAESGRFDALVLVTSRVRHALPAAIDGVPLHIVQLAGAAL